VFGGDHQRQVGIVAGLGRGDAVEAERLDLPGGCGEALQGRAVLPFAGVLFGIGPIRAVSTRNAIGIS